MPGDFELAGFTMTRDEWEGLDEDAKALLWPDLVEEPYYELYQVVWPDEESLRRSVPPRLQLELKLFA